MNRQLSQHKQNRTENTFDRVNVVREGNMSVSVASPSTRGPLHGFFTLFLAQAQQLSTFSSR